jgi:hypothetical protein
MGRPLAGLISTAVFSSAALRLSAVALPRVAFLDAADLVLAFILLPVS